VVRGVGCVASMDKQKFIENAAQLAKRKTDARLATMQPCRGAADTARLIQRHQLRCGADPSIRALGARPTSFRKLIGDHGPQMSCAVSRRLNALQPPRASGPVAVTEANNGHM